MKRDWDLIRRILGGLEEEPDPDRWLMSNRIDGWTKEEAAYHVWLLIQGRLIAGKCNRELPGGKGFVCYGIRLTWQGHEFLAAVRDDAARRRIRRLLKDKAVDLSYDAIKAAAGLSGFYTDKDRAADRSAKADGAGIYPYRQPVLPAVLPPCLIQT